MVTDALPFRQRTLRPLLQAKGRASAGRRLGRLSRRLRTGERRPVVVLRQVCRCPPASPGISSSAHDSPLLPADVFGPGGPAGPLEATGPVVPLAPAAPAGPAGPAGPIWPIGPAGPVGPMAQSARWHLRRPSFLALRDRPWARQVQSRPVLLVVLAGPPAGTSARAVPPAPRRDPVVPASDQ